MPTYTFKMLDGCGDVEDESGVSLRDHDHALRYARDVIHELMRNREVETRSWRLDVYENGDGPIYAIPFAGIDPTLDHLVPKLRTMVEAMCEHKGWLGEVRPVLSPTMEKPGLGGAPPRGKPYLASRFGRSTSRDN